MDFDMMAKIVHELVQRQGNGDSEVLKTETFHTMTSCEQEVIFNGFSKLQLSGDSLAIETGPNVYWA